MTPWTAACQAFLSFTISHSLLKLMSIELVIPSNHLILCCSLLLLPSIFPNIRVFSNESSIVYIYHNFFIHSSADGHLGCFHSLAIVCILMADLTLLYSRNQHNIVKQLSSNKKMFFFFFLRSDCFWDVKHSNGSSVLLALGASPSSAWLVFKFKCLPPF